MCEYCNRTEKDIENEKKRDEMIKKLRAINFEIKRLEDSFESWELTIERYIKMYKLLYPIKIKILEQFLELEYQGRERAKKYEENKKEYMESRDTWALEGFTEYL